MHDRKIKSGKLVPFSVLTDQKIVFQSFPGWKMAKLFSIPRRHPAIRFCSRSTNRNERERKSCRKTGQPGSQATATDVFPNLHFDFIRLRSSKDQVESLYLQRGAAPSWCGTSRIIGDCCLSWGFSSLPRAAAPRDPSQRKKRLEKWMEWMRFKPDARMYMSKRCISHQRHSFQPKIPWWVQAMRYWPCGTVFRVHLGLLLATQGRDRLWMVEKQRSGLRDAIGRHLHDNKVGNELEKDPRHRQLARKYNPWKENFKSDFDTLSENYRQSQAIFRLRCVCV